MVLSAPITRLLTAGPDNVLGIHAAASAVNRAAAADIAGWILGGGESRPFDAMSTTNALGVKHVDYRADDVDGLRKTEAPGANPLEGHRVRPAARYQLTVCGVGDSAALTCALRSNSLGRLKGPHRGRRACRVSAAGRGSQLRQQTYTESQRSSDDKRTSVCSSCAV